MTISCTRRIQFCSGHRVMGHENKCSNLHGHNYVLFATAEAYDLDAIGRVIDFSVIKEKLGGWIDEHWDHGFIVYTADHAAIEAIKTFESLEPKGQKIFRLDENPTAENMADYLLQEICPSLFGNQIRITKILLWETENCFAEATR